MCERQSEAMKYKDIANKYDKSVNTIKTWKSRNNWDRDISKSMPKSITNETKAKKVSKVSLPDEL